MKNMTAKTKLVLAALTTLCLTGCLDKEEIAFIGDAENILFTSQGDLLVTGGESIYRINKLSNAQGQVSYQAESLYLGEKCSFTGIAQRDNWVFSVCGKPYIRWQGWTFKAGIETRLMAANLAAQGSDGAALPLRFERITGSGADNPLDAITLPNGLAFTPDGKLLIADSNYLGQGSVGRITLDLSGPLPRVAHFEKDWLGAQYGISTPNGVRVADNTVYLSDNNKLRRIHLDSSHNAQQLFTNAQGQLVSNMDGDNLLYQGGLTIDDIMPYCGGVALTQFAEGRLVFVAASGKSFPTAPFAFKGPSSLAIGQGPDFNGYDLLVTEKGILQDNTSTYGNQLSRIHMGIDLHAPQSCAEIAAL
jgi:hypothetical protein